MTKYFVLLRHVATGFVNNLGNVYAASCADAIRMLGGKPEWSDLSHTAGFLVGCAIAGELTAKGYNIVVMDATQFCCGTLRSAEDLEQSVRVALRRS